MTVTSKYFAPIARCLLFSLAMAFLGLACGCGEVPSHNVLDEQAEKRVDGAKDSMKKYLDKQAIKRTGGKTGKR
jgi:hypothetical protein